MSTNLLFLDDIDEAFSFALLTTLLPLHPL
jgi:hypothetical protein